MTVVDVSEADFEREVIERSREVPVVVDFWAEWCGPCRTIGPVLERTANAHEGEVVLAKVDTDANQALAQRYDIRSIPAVKAFKDGEVIDEFVGSHGPPVVERFVENLIPSEADALAAADDEPSLRRALELEPGRADATVKLAKLLAARGADDEALELLERVRGSFAADGLAARLRLRRDGVDGLDGAWSALDDGEYEQALEILLGALPSADGHTDDVRIAVVGICDELGVGHPLARDARRRLAAALY